MRVLVTGALGQLGRDVVSSWTARGDDVVATDRTTLDLTAPDDVVLAGVRDAAPDVVVNAAAYTAVDAAEAAADLAFAVNAEGTGRLAQACGRTGAHLVHVSTDYVFDGELDRPYVEGDPTNPRSVYGRSKLAGEAAAIEALGEAVTIVRTSWVCGEHGGNMVRTVLGLLAADPDREFSFVDDQRGCPTFTADLAPALRTLAVERVGGVVHLTNARAVSWYEFVREIVDAAGADPGVVHPIATAELDPPRPAPRPANSVLDNARWRALGHPPLRDHAEPLAELVARLR